MLGHPELGPSGPQMFQSRSHVELVGPRLAETEGSCYNCNNNANS